MVYWFSVRQGLLCLGGMFRRSASLAIPHRDFFCRVSGLDVSRAAGIARSESVSEPQPNRTIQATASSVAMRRSLLKFSTTPGRTEQDVRF